VISRRVVFEASGPHCVSSRSAHVRVVSATGLGTFRFGRGCRHGLILIGMVAGISVPRTSGIARPPVGGAQPIHQIGDTIHVSCWIYRVNGYTRTPYIGDGFLGQKADAEYMSVYLSIRNEDRTESTLPRIVLVDDQGRGFEQSSRSFLLRNSFSILKSLNPRLKAEGLSCSTFRPVSTR
jgi:hypothetical protein